MDGRTIAKIRTSTGFGTWNGFLVRDSPEPYSVQIFGPDFYQYGTWYGFWYGLEPGTVPNNPYRNGFFFRYDSWYGAKFRKIEKIEKSFLKILFSHWKSVPNSVPKRIFLTKFRTTFPTNKSSEPKSVLRTVPISFVPKFVPRTEPNNISYRNSVPRTVPYQFVPTVRPVRGSYSCDEIYLDQESAGRSEAMSAYFLQLDALEWMPFIVV